MDVTVAQMLALFMALDLGLKPDNPKGMGMTTRAVRGVQVYDCEKFKDQKRFEVLAD